MKLRFNFRLLFLLALLLGLGIREVALDLRPSLVRPDLRLFAYVSNTADGTVTAVNLVTLSRRGHDSRGRAADGNPRESRRARKSGA